MPRKAKRVKRVDNIYEVETILNKRFHYGKVQYLIQWKGYSHDHNSWEPIKNITDVCPQLVEQFEEGYENINSSEEEKEDNMTESEATDDSSCSASTMTDSAPPMKRYSYAPKVFATTILGVVRTTQFGDKKDFSFVVIFSNKTNKFVPRKVANMQYPQLVIAYYETCIFFTKEFETFGRAEEPKETYEKITSTKCFLPDENAAGNANNNQNFLDDGLPADENVEEDLYKNLQDDYFRHSEDEEDIRQEEKDQDPLQGL